MTSTPDPAETGLRGDLGLTVPAGLAAVLAALASLVTCYVTIFFDAILGLTVIGFNPHVQAVLMWALALAAVIYLWRDRTRHRNQMPLALGALAAASLIVTLYLGYDERVEALAYVMLVIATLLNQNLLLDQLNRQVKTQAGEIGDLNAQLARKVASQEHQISRLERLKQFLAPQVAELVVAEDKEALLDTHRRYIACLFCDIRNFTDVSEAVEPEDVIAILQQFHDRIGGLAAARGGTIGFRSGDGVMVFFNDPLPCDAPVMEAVGLAGDVCGAFNDIAAPWRRLGHEIGLGIGIASGFATLGLVGFQGRSDYTAIGAAVNLAARLCDRAADGEILISLRAYHDVEDKIEAESLGSAELKGISKPVEVLRLATPCDKLRKSELN